MCLLFSIFKLKRVESSWNIGCFFFRFVVLRGLETFWFSVLDIFVNSGKDFILRLLKLEIFKNIFQKDFSLKLSLFLYNFISVHIKISKNWQIFPLNGISSRYFTKLRIFSEPWLIPLTKFHSAKWFFPILFQSNGFNSSNPGRQLFERISWIFVSLLPENVVKTRDPSFFLFPSSRSRPPGRAGFFVKIWSYIISTGAKLRGGALDINKLTAPQDVLNCIYYFPAGH